METTIGRIITIILCIVMVNTGLFAAISDNAEAGPHVNERTLTDVNSDEHRVWQELVGSQYDIFYDNNIGAGGGWNPQVQITYSDPEDSIWPLIAQDTSSEIFYIAWTEHESGVDVIYYIGSGDYGQNWLCQRFISDTLGSTDGLDLIVENGLLSIKSGSTTLISLYPDIDGDFIPDKDDIQPTVFELVGGEGFYYDAISIDDDLGTVVAIDYGGASTTKPDIVQKTPSIPLVTSTGTYVDISTTATEEFTAVIKMNYDEANIHPSGNEEDLVLYYFEYCWKPYSRYLKSDEKTGVDMTNNYVWAVTSEFTDPTPALDDNDFDGLPDWFEILYDSDGDDDPTHSSNVGLNPLDDDTDGDFILDDQEDFDNDGLINIEEYSNPYDHDSIDHTNPNNGDTDLDWLGDGQEINKAGATSQTVNTFYYDDIEKSSETLYYPSGGGDQIIEVKIPVNDYSMEHITSASIYMEAKKLTVPTWTLPGITYEPPPGAIIVDDVPGGDPIEDFTSIQEAVDACIGGEVIFVYSGTYYENVVIDKPIMLMGENRDTTIIDGNGFLPGYELYEWNNCLHLRASNIVVSGFKIQNGNTGILTDRTKSNIQIIDNKIEGSRYGIIVFNSYNTVIQNNIIQGNIERGLAMFVARFTTVQDNTIIDNYVGITIENTYYTIQPQDLNGFDDLIRPSTKVHDRLFDQYLGDSYYDSLFLEVFSGNPVLPFYDHPGFFEPDPINPYNNLIYHNNIVNNLRRQALDYCFSKWDNGYPSGGNYWSDYPGSDSGGDGIGDTPYIINYRNQDDNPFMDYDGWYIPIIDLSLDVGSDDIFEWSDQWFLSYTIDVTEFQKGLNANLQGHKDGDDGVVDGKVTIPIRLRSTWPVELFVSTLDIDVEIYITDPTDSDSDDDGMTDGWELYYGLNPVDPTDSNLDEDEYAGDGLTALEEFSFKTNPNLIDSDGDMIDDTDEIRILDSKMDDIVFEGAGDIMRYIDVPVGEVISTATLLFWGEPWNGEYPRNPTMNVGNDGSDEWISSDRIEDVSGDDELGYRIRYVQLYEDATTSYTNLKLEANDDIADDVPLLSPTPLAGDCIYIGDDYKFNKLIFDIGVPVTGGSIQWKYYDGATWSPIPGITDNTNGYKVSGQQSVEFPTITDWKRTTVDSTYGFWICAQPDPSDIPTAQPVASRIYIEASSRQFTVSNTPIKDKDSDSDVIDDIKVYEDESLITVSSADGATGLVVLTDHPNWGSSITIEYLPEPYNWKESTDDLTTEINNYLTSHTDATDLRVITDGYITVPIVFGSSSAGVIKMAGVNIITESGLELQLSNSIVFYGASNRIVRYIDIPENAVVDSGYITLKGKSIQGTFPTNTELNIGDDGDVEWRGRMQIYSELVSDKLGRQAAFCRLSDGGWSNKDNEIRDTQANDVPVFTDPIVNDEFYIGSQHRDFSDLYLDVYQARIGGAIEWYYYDTLDTQWKSLESYIYYDGTNDMGITGFNKISFNKPSEWDESEVNGQIGYWLKAVPSSSITTIPILSYGRTMFIELALHSPPIADWDKDGDVDKDDVFMMYYPSSTEDVLYVHEASGIIGFSDYHPYSVEEAWAKYYTHSGPFMISDTTYDLSSEINDYLSTYDDETDAKCERDHHISVPMVFISDTDGILEFTDIDIVLNSKIHDYRTNPANSDTDGDGLLDGYKDVNDNGIYDSNTDYGEIFGWQRIVHGTDMGHVYPSPLERDSDDDGAIDHLEYIGLTDPNIVDSDSDGMLDGEELSYDVTWFESEENLYTSWKTETPTNLVRYESPSSVVNDKIYVFGGWGGSYLDSVEEYDPSSGTWTLLTGNEMPTERYGATSSTLNGLIYVIGGYNGGYRNTMEVFHPYDYSWDVTRTPLPAAKHQLTSSAVDGKIYCIGGQGGDPRSLYVYDPVSNQWDDTKTPMPTGRYRHTASVVNGKIYVFGGWVSGTPLNTAEVYDPVKDEWETLTAMPTARAGVTSAVIDDKIYVIGGETTSYWYSTVEVYDPATDTWAPSIPIPSGRTRLTSSVVNGKIFVIGGANSPGGYLRTVESFPNSLAQMVSDSTASMDNAASDTDPSAALGGIVSLINEVPTGEYHVYIRARTTSGSSDIANLRINSNGYEAVWDTDIDFEVGSFYRWYGIQDIQFTNKNWISVYDPDGSGIYVDKVVVVKSDYNQLVADALVDDTDGDGLLDGKEQALNNNLDEDILTNTMDLDSDGDGLLDNLEDTNLNGELDATETDPWDIDTDKDGLPDGWIDYNEDGDSDDEDDFGEYEDRNLNGIVDSTLPADWWDIGTNTKGIGETDPTNPDSDNDGLLDGEELGIEFEESVTNPMDTFDELRGTRSGDSEDRDFKQSDVIVIDHGIHPDDSNPLFDYKTSAQGYNVYYKGSSMGGPIFLFEANGYQFSYQPTQITSGGKVVDIIQNTIPTINGINITYNNTYQDIDLRYISTFSGIKEDYILHSLPPQVTSDMIFEGYVNYDVSGLSIFIDDSIALGNLITSSRLEFRNQNGDDVFFIPSPKVFDSAGNSADITFDVKTENGKIYFNLIVPYTFLSNQAVYPVYVDPQIDITTDTTWSGSYHVTDNVIIYNGAKLTINAGTDVTFDDGTMIQVGYPAPTPEGTLYLTAAPAPIQDWTTFKPHSGNQGQFQIRFTQHSVGSLMRDFKIKDSQYASIWTESSENMQIINGYFDNNNYGVYVDGGICQVMSSTFGTTSGNTRCIQAHNSGIVTVTSSTFSNSVDYDVVATLGGDIEVIDSVSTSDPSPPGWKLGVDSGHSSEIEFVTKFKYKTQVDGADMNGPTAQFMTIPSADQTINDPSGANYDIDVIWGKASNGAFNAYLTDDLEATYPYGNGHTTYWLHKREDVYLPQSARETLNLHNHAPEATITSLNMKFYEYVTGTSDLFDYETDTHTDALGYSRTESADLDLIWSFDSSNPSDTTETNWLFQGTIGGDQDELEITAIIDPVTGDEVSGEHTITLYLYDNGGQSGTLYDTVTLTVTIIPHNDKPTIGNLVNHQMLEDSGPWTIDLTGYESDIETTNPEHLDWAVYLPPSQTIIDHVDGEYSNNDVLTFHLIENANGDVIIKFILFDNNAQQDDDIISATAGDYKVQVNDLSLFNVGDTVYLEHDGSTNEFGVVENKDPNYLYLHFQLSNSYSSGDKIYSYRWDVKDITLSVTPVNDPPTIVREIPDINSADGMSWSIDMTEFEYDVDVDDYDTFLDWYLTDLNDLRTFETILFTVSGEESDDDVLTFTPIAAGTMDIKFHLKDDEGLEVYQVVTITIAPPPGFPYADPIPDQEVDEDSSTWTIDLGQYEHDDPDVEPVSGDADLTWSVTNIYTPLFDAEILSDGDTLQITPKSNAYGSDTIILALTDEEGKTTITTLLIVINPVDDTITAAIESLTSSVYPNKKVTLDGSQSSDTDGELVYRWVIDTQPDDSDPMIFDSMNSIAYFTSAETGEYIIYLVVGGETVSNDYIGGGPSSVVDLFGDGSVYIHVIGAASPYTLYVDDSATYGSNPVQLDAKSNAFFDIESWTAQPIDSDLYIKFFDPETGMWEISEEIAQSSISFFVIAPSLFTNPLDDDSDDDTIKDGDELFWNQDFDGDGLINALDDDSDNDGVLDADESNWGTNPILDDVIPLPGVKHQGIFSQRGDDHTYMLNLDSTKSIAVAMDGPEDEDFNLFLSNPEETYESIADEPNSDGTAESSIPLIGDSSENEGLTFWILIENPPDEWIYQIGFDISNIIGDIATLDYEYEIEIAETTATALDSDPDSLASTDFITLKSNWNPRIDFGSTTGWKTVLLDQRYYMSSSQNYIIKVKYISGGDLKDDSADYYSLTLDDDGISNDYLAKLYSLRSLVESGNGDVSTALTSFLSNIKHIDIGDTTGEYDFGEAIYDDSTGDEPGYLDLMVDTLVVDGSEVSSAGDEITSWDDYTCWWDDVSIGTIGVFDYQYDEIYVDINDDGEYTPGEDIEVWPKSGNNIPDYASYTGPAGPNSPIGTGYVDSGDGTGGTADGQFNGESGFEEDIYDESEDGDGVVDLLLDTLISSGDVDGLDGMELVDFTAAEKFFDDTPAGYNDGEYIYKDVDSSDDVSIDDIRLMPTIVSEQKMINIRLFGMRPGKIVGDGTSNELLTIHNAPASNYYVWIVSSQSSEKGDGQGIFDVWYVEYDIGQLYIYGDNQIGNIQIFKLPNAGGSGTVVTLTDPNSGSTTDTINIGEYSYILPDVSSGYHYIAKISLFVGGSLVNPDMVVDYIEEIELSDLYMGRRSFLEDWNVELGTWEISNGELIQTDTSSNDEQIVTGDSSWSDYEFITKGKITAGNGVDDLNLQLIVRYENADNYYVCKAQNGVGNTRIGKMVNGVFTDSITTYAGDIGLVTGQWYDLKAVVTGSTIEFYVDDTLYVTYSGATEITNGKIGLAIKGMSANFAHVNVEEELYYDDFEEMAYHFDLNIDFIRQKYPGLMDSTIIQVEDVSASSGWQEKTDDPTASGGKYGEWSVGGYAEYQVNLDRVPYGLKMTFKGTGDTNKRQIKVFLDGTEVINKEIDLNELPTNIWRTLTVGDFNVDTAGLHTIKIQCIAGGSFKADRIIFEPHAMPERGISVSTEEPLDVKVDEIGFDHATLIILPDNLDLLAHVDINTINIYYIENKKWKPGQSMINSNGKILSIVPHFSPIRMGALQEIDDSYYSIDGTSFIDHDAMVPGAIEFGGKLFLFYVEYAIGGREYDDDNLENTVSYKNIRWKVYDPNSEGDVNDISSWERKGYIEGGFAYSGLNNPVPVVYNGKLYLFYNRIRIDPSDPTKANMDICVREYIPGPPESWGPELWVTDNTDMDQKPSLCLADVDTGHSGDELILFFTRSDAAGGMESTEIWYKYLTGANMDWDSGSSDWQGEFQLTKDSTDPTYGYGTLLDVDMASTVTTSDTGSGDIVYVYWMTKRWNIFNPGSYTISMLQYDTSVGIIFGDTSNPTIYEDETDSGIWKFGTADLAAGWSLNSDVVGTEVYTDDRWGSFDGIQDPFTVVTTSFGRFLAVTRYDGFTPNQGFTGGTADIYIGWDEDDDGIFDHVLPVTNDWESANNEFIKDYTPWVTEYANEIHVFFTRAYLGKVDDINEDHGDGIISDDLDFNGYHFDGGANGYADIDSDVYHTHFDPTMDFDADSDGDGLTNFEEFSMGIDPVKADTDEDGLWDGWQDDNGDGDLDWSDDGDGVWESGENEKPGELYYGTNPQDPDTDSDHLSDGLEAFGWFLKVYTEVNHPNYIEHHYTSNPLKSNSDNDEFDDFTEFLIISNPKDGTDPYDDSGPTLYDTDSDNLPSLIELCFYPYVSFKVENGKLYLEGISLDWDSDDDGLSDGYEVFTDYFEDIEGIQGSWLFDPDSDNDGLLDGEEDYNRNDPGGKGIFVEIDSNLDGICEDGTGTLGDQNGDTEAEEKDGLAGFSGDTNPILRDTDGDGLLDGWDDKNGNGNFDTGEQMGERGDYVGGTGGGIGTDPWNPDTDYDGLLDLEEIDCETSPFNTDFDNDGLMDGRDLEPLRSYTTTWADSQIPAGILRLETTQNIGPYWEYYHNTVKGEVESQMMGKLVDVNGINFEVTDITYDRTLGEVYYDSNPGDNQPGKISVDHFVEDGKLDVYTYHLANQDDLISSGGSSLWLDLSGILKRDKTHTLTLQYSFSSTGDPTVGETVSGFLFYLFDKTDIGLNYLYNSLAKGNKVHKNAYAVDIELRADYIVDEDLILYISPITIQNNVFNFIDPVTSGLSIAAFHWTITTGMLVGYFKQDASFKVSLSSTLLNQPGASLYWPKGQGNPSVLRINSEDSPVIELRGTIYYWSGGSVQQDEIKARTTIDSFMQYKKDIKDYGYSEYKFTGDPVLKYVAENGGWDLDGNGQIETSNVCGVNEVVDVILITGRDSHDISSLTTITTGWTDIDSTPPSSSIDELGICWKMTSPHAWIDTSKWQNAPADSVSSKLITSLNHQGIFTMVFSQDGLDEMEYDGQFDDGAGGYIYVDGGSIDFSASSMYTLEEISLPDVVYPKYTLEPAPVEEIVNGDPGIQIKMEQTLSGSTYLHADISADKFIEDWYSLLPTIKEGHKIIKEWKSVIKDIEDEKTIWTKWDNIAIKGKEKAAKDVYFFKKAVLAQMIISSKEITEIWMNEDINTGQKTILSISVIGSSAIYIGIQKYGTQVPNFAQRLGMKTLSWARIGGIALTAIAVGKLLVEGNFHDAMNMLCNIGAQVAITAAIMALGPPGWAAFCIYLVVDQLVKTLSWFITGEEKGIGDWIWEGIKWLFGIEDPPEEEEPESSWEGTNNYVEVPAVIFYDEEDGYLFIPYEKKDKIEIKFYEKTGSAVSRYVYIYDPHNFMGSGTMPQSMTYYYGY